MQDIQNIPNPDVDSIEDGGFGSHSDFPDTDVEQPKEKEETPTPPDRLPHAAIEEPPTDENGDDNRQKQIV